MDAARVLTYRFFALSHVTRIDIARKLKLVRNEDEGVLDYELFNRVFKRASADRNLLAQLWQEVEHAHADGKYNVNPFL